MPMDWIGYSTLNIKTGIKFSNESSVKEHEENGNKDTLMICTRECVAAQNRGGSMIDNKLKEY